MPRKDGNAKVQRIQELRRSSAASPHSTKIETDYEAIARELREQELERRVTRLERIVERMSDDGK